ncbi:hypothetical protein HPG69_010673 [Diceros bicornis minor]|uniref:Ig-like domain-containing protein n=1 Tax=Diceros bicornis minor TaxID=77932 RepID=A0A7J7EWX0_DICBM|nr:hypothetical protein HPG69_010673 [Diceros bicornis minor]
MTMEIQTFLNIHPGSLWLLQPLTVLLLLVLLLLQTTRLVFQEGEPIHLRCHRFTSKPLYKVTFYQNGKDQTFSPRNSSFSIRQANLSHSGEYHCTGVIGEMLYTSQPVNITVQGWGGEITPESARHSARSRLPSRKRLRRGWGAKSKEPSLQLTGFVYFSVFSFQPIKYVKGRGFQKQKMLVGV